VLPWQADVFGWDYPGSQCLVQFEGGSVANQSAQLSPFLPSPCARSGLVDMTPIWVLVDGWFVALVYRLGDVAPVGVADVGYWYYPQVQAAVIQQAELEGLEALGLDCQIHDVLVVLTQQWWGVGGVQFDVALHSLEICAQAGQPSGFQVWEWSGCVCKQWGAGAYTVLSPGDCYPEHLSSMGVGGSPGLQKVWDLAIALFIIQMEEGGPT
jgi:hypothetical protein